MAPRKGKNVSIRLSDGEWQRLQAAHAALEWHTITMSSLAKECLLIGLEMIEKRRASPEEKPPKRK